MRRVPIERKCKVSPADIARDHLQGRGMPVIVTDGTELWPARSKWTFEFFRSAYGSDLASAWLGLRSGIGKVTKLGAYIDFLDTSELPGIWIDGSGQPLRAPPGPGSSAPYLLGWPAFQNHPELYDDIRPAPRL